MRRVFISGGHGGLARAIVECFSAAGWETDAPSHAALDVGDRSAVRRWFDCHAAYDLAVCAAGITRDRPFLKQTEEEWDEVMNVNVTGAAWCGRCAAAAMVREKREGQVVMIGSYAALRPAPSQAAYAASKAALAGLVKSLAREWGKDGIRVNLVLPGFMLTEMTAVLRDSVKEAALSRHVLNRLNTPEQAAAFILFLQDVLTAASGQVFDLDSGFIIRVQALILKKNNLRKNLIHQGHPVPVENMEFQTRKEESIHVYTLSKRPEKPCFSRFPVFKIIAGYLFY